MSNSYSTPDEQNPGHSAQNSVQSVRVLRIITFAMVAGVLVFMGITLFMNQGAIDGTPKLMSWIGLGMGGLMVVNHLVVPNIVAGAALNGVNRETLRNADETERFSLIYPAFQTRHIVARAMLEAGAFMNLVLYMMTRYVGNLAAASVLVVLIAIRFPSVSTVEFWVQDRIRRIELS
ncbi:MAG: hypothetical protein GY903_07635 [Fuerstiella sp.]|nr:hypothetical protein [Fuerstiella sp.]MCP4854348.1 hypothetical protein [Fuerstiella sp.]